MQAKLIPAVTETKVVEVTPAMVQLTLTLDEAKSLSIVCRHIGGSPDTRRGHFDAMQAALRNAGVVANRDDSIREINLADVANISFKR